MRMKSSIKGVYYSKSARKWYAQYNCLDSGKRFTLGLYKNRLDAERERTQWNESNNFYNPLSSAGCLRRVYRYDENTGDIYFKINGDRGIRVGNKAGTLPIKGHGYKCVKSGGLNGTKINVYAHRLAWFLYYGKWPDCEIDHIDHDRSNNRIENLREASTSVNSRNKSKIKSNKSGVNGVFLVGEKWGASIGVDGKMVWLGTFKRKEDAVVARKIADIKYGFHPNHGN